MDESGESVATLRVSQLDAATLDKEVAGILDSQLKKFLESIPGYDFSWLEPELEAAIKSLFWFYVFRNEGASLGQKMMDMSYRPGTDSILGGRTKWAYFFFTVVLPWLRQRLPSVVGWKDEAKKARVERTLEHVCSAIELVNLLHFLWFVNRGGFRTILERFLGLRAIHNSQPFLEELDTEFTERELLWHGFSDILIFVLPMLNYRRFYNAIVRLGKRVRRGWSGADNDKDEISEKIKRTDILSPCAYCEQVPPTLPCHLGCSHVYCYYCLAANLEADKNYACAVCGHSKGDNAVVFAIGAKIVE